MKLSPAHESAEDELSSAFAPTDASPIVLWSDRNRQRGEASMRLVQLREAGLVKGGARIVPTASAALENADAPILVCSGRELHALFRELEGAQRWDEGGQPLEIVAAIPPHDLAWWLSLSRISDRWTLVPFGDLHPGGGTPCSLQYVRVRPSQPGDVPWYGNSEWLDTALADAEQPESTDLNPPSAGDVGRRVRPSVGADESVTEMKEEMMRLQARDRMWQSRYDAITSTFAGKVGLRAWRIIKRWQ